MATEITITVPAAAEQLEVVHAALERFYAATECMLGRAVDVAAWLPFTTAVAEVAANVVRHAYPAGMASGRMRVRLRLARQGVLAACFADCGEPFVPTAAPSNAPDAAELPEGGMGLAICRASLTRLRYRRTARGRNCWLLLKRIGAA